MRSIGPAVRLPETGSTATAIAGGSAIRVVAGGAVAIVELRAIHGVGGGKSIGGQAPLDLDPQGAARTRPVQARRSCNQIVASLIAEEECRGRHDRRSADFAGIVEMHVEPEGRTADTYLQRVRPLAAISDQGRACS